MSKQETKETKDKLRVYEYAKQLSMSSKEIITILKRMNVPVNNHMSVMEDHMIEAVERFFQQVRERAAARMAAQQAAQQAAKAKAAAEAARKAQQAAQAQQDTPVYQRPAAPARPKEDRQRQTAQASAAARPQPQGQAQAAKPAGAAPAQPHARDKRASAAQTVQRPAASAAPAAQPKTDDRAKGAGAAPAPRGDRPQPAGRGDRPDRGDRGGRPQGRGGRGPGGPGRGRMVIPAPPPQVTAQQSGRDRRGESRGGRDGGHGRKGKDVEYGGKRFMDDGRFEEAFKSKGKGKHAREKGAQTREKIDNTPKKIIVRGEMTVGELAKLLHKDVAEVIKKLLMMGVIATINQVLDLDTIVLTASEFGVETEVKIPVEETEFETIEEQDDPESLVTRPPVVTIMGHVDHGKTTLLDAIRETRVAAGEAGGITQHIGAYQVEAQGKKITFLDTPGHEAFTAMRARGAQVTDITVLVVAADDGVMPQTVEAINHAKAANVPIIVAVNKIDLPEANPDRVKQELMNYGLVPEEWGGDTIYVPVSAKQRTNLDSLLEMILLVAEVNDYKANPNKRARGTVLEAELDKGKGPVARVLVQHGTLKVGDALVAGDVFGRVRAMINDRGRRIKEAGPSTPVEITGLSDVPQAGDQFMVFEDERKAREIAEKRAIKSRQSALQQQHRVTLDDLFSKIKEGQIKELNVILKADVQGSVEALRSALEKIDIEGVRVRIIHSGVGAITESDIQLALASSAIVIGFNVRPEPGAAAMAEQEKVDVRLHRIIYEVISEIEQAMKGMLEPVKREKVIGHAEVRETFKISKVGTIAGCYVTDGKVVRNADARLVRNGIVIYEGKIESLRRFKDDVREVPEGYECGLTLERYNDIQVGDRIEVTVMETVET
ncbi:MAG: translation initiation factor IF-2 [Paenibacillaceae bacterium ZCTH02-B3]|nr:MAG: translation initiation factor IF-2 [Paenibacillaceae bacterium ZCTH02-B3]